MRKGIHWILLVVSLVASLRATGQSNYAVLGGGVSDPQGRTIVGAQIELTSVNTSAGRRQAQSGYPFTVSVFGDTANAGTLLGENPIRANYTGEAVFGEGTRRLNGGSTLRHSRLPPHSLLGMSGGIRFTDQECGPSIWRYIVSLKLPNASTSSFVRNSSTHLITRTSGRQTAS